MFERVRYLCRSQSSERENGESDPLLERESLEKAAESGSYYQITQITEMGQAGNNLYDAFRRFFVSINVNEAKTRRIIFHFLQYCLALTFDISTWTVQLIQKNHSSRFETMKQEYISHCFAFLNLNIFYFVLFRSCLLLFFNKRRWIPVIKLDTI